MSTLKRIKMRNEFYRDNFRRVSLMLLLLIVINIILFISFLVVLNIKPTPKYFATTTSGQIIVLNPLSKPISSNSAVTSWISRVIPNINSLDFLNYRTQIEEKKKYFTTYGWSQYLKAFKPVINKIRSSKLISHGVASDVPIIVQQGDIGGKYSWKFQVPIIITYQRDDSVSTKHVIWTILVQRDNNNPQSLFGIAQIVQKGS